VVAHLHYVLIGANVFPVFAALYYWWPKLTGRMLDERLGKLSFWMMFVGFNAGFFPMHLSGMLGMRRRVYTYLAEDGLGVLNLLTSLGSVLLALGILVSLVAFAKSFRAGRTALPNPWAADTLEWLTPSPPPSYGFLRIPTVESLHPLWDDHDELADPRNERTLERGRQTLSTTVIDAVPSAISKGEDDTIVPLLLAGAITGLLALLMTKCLLPAGALVVAAVGLAFGWLWPKREERPV
jgi:cytochrome c oxidase subunit 1/cytochrome c oxidase subunit I+III